MQLLFQTQRWVKAYRKERLNNRLNTNNGVERQNRTFKKTFLQDNRKLTLSGMVNVLVTQFLPCSFHK